MALVEGFVTGLAMIAFVGPVFFTLLQITLEHGFKSGFFVAFGIFISDVVAVVLCYYGAGAFFETSQNKFWIGIIGMMVLFSIGLAYVIKPKVEPKVKLKEGGRSYVGYFIKGFLVNFVNPFVFAVWIGITGYAQGNATWNSWDHLVFLSVALLVILCTDTLKALLAEKIKPFIRPNVLKYVFRIIGVIMILFGFRILWYLIENY